MRRILATNWWLLALRGFVALLFALLAFAWPALSLTVLVAVFGVYAVADGAFAVAAGVRARSLHRWWLLPLEGAVGLAAGAAALAWPHMAAVVLVYVVAGWAVLTGVLEVLVAVHLRGHHGADLFFGVGGCASIVLGLILFVSPLEGAPAMSVLVGAYALVFGLAMVALAWRIRLSESLIRRGDGRRARGMRPDPV